MPSDVPPLLGLAILLVSGLIIALAALTWWTLHRLLHPPRRTYATALAQGRPGQPDQLRDIHGKTRTYSSWTLSWRGLELPVWDIVGDTPHGPIVIITHGWGDSRIGALTRADALLPVVSRVIAWDLPGHGDAPGSCLLGVHEHEALWTLVDRISKSDMPVVLLGWSLGAGISLAALSGWQDAAARHVRGIVCEAPYRLPQTPARNMLRFFGLPSTINLPLALAIARLRIGAPPFWQRAQGTFDRAALARGVTCPLLVIHGEDDAIAPVDDGRTIAAAAIQGEVLIVPGAGHYSLWTAAETRDMLTERVRAFVERVSGNR